MLLNRFGAQFGFCGDTIDHCNDSSQWLPRCTSTSAPSSAPSGSPTASQGGESVVNVSVRTTTGNNNVVTDAAMFAELVDINGLSSGVLPLFPENTFVSVDTAYDGTVSVGADSGVDLENLASIFFTLSDGRTRLLGRNTFVSFMGLVTYMDNSDEGSRHVVQSNSGDESRVRPPSSVPRSTATTAVDVCALPFLSLCLCLVLPFALPHGVVPIASLELPIIFLFPSLH